MSKKLLFNFNREVIQNYTYVKYVGTIITATNTLEKPIKSAILKGSTKYRDIDTGEILEAFEEGRNLELVSVKMPVLTTYTHENIFKNYIQDGSYWGKDFNCTTTDLKYGQNGSYVKITGGSSLCYSGFVSRKLPQGTYKFSCKVKVGKVGDSYRILAHNNPNAASNNTSGFASDKITSTKEIETFEYVGYFANANAMLFYAYYKGQEIEYYDIVFTKLSDDDVTANTQNYTYKSNILTVNEDVTLRSNGDICDELNLLTGQLTQRIGEDGVVLSQEVVKTVDLSILDQSGNKVSSISSFNDTTHITASSETIPPIFEGYLATKEG